MKNHRFISNIIKNLLIILFGTIISFFIAEALLRIYGLFNKESSKITDLRGFVISDEKVGWRMKPNSAFLAKTKEFEVIYKTNSLGYRDGEFNIKKEENAYRIFVFGDSFTFGAGVEEEKTFPRQLERLLNSSGANLIYEVYNFGVGRYGNDQELLILLENLKYKPDLVLVELIAENRFIFNSMEYGSALNRNVEFLNRNSKKTENSNLNVKLCMRGRIITNAFNLRAFLLKNSELYKRFEQLFGLRLRQYFGGLKTVDNSKMVYAWQVFEGVFRKFRDLSYKHKVPIIVIYYPYAYDAYNNNNEIYQKLCQILNPLGIKVINLIPPLYKNRNNQLYYPLDGHPTAIGHKIVAEEILLFLKKYKYL